MPAALAKEKFTTTITIAKVFDPKPGRFSVGVKTTEGGMFSIPVKKRHELQEGETYEVEYEGDYKDITSYRHIAPHREPRVAPAPQPQTNGKKMDQLNYDRPTHPRDAKRMFICSQMNAMISSRQIVLQADIIAEAIEMLAKAYDQTLGTEDTELAGG